MAPWTLTGNCTTLGLGTATGQVIDGAAAGDHTGISVAGQRDLNGDGLGDILIGAPGNEACAGDLRDTGHRWPPPKFPSHSIRQFAELRLTKAR